MKSNIPLTVITMKSGDQPGIKLREHLGNPPAFHGDPEKARVEQDGESEKKGKAQDVNGLDDRLGPSGIPEPDAEGCVVEPYKQASERHSSTLSPRNKSQPVLSACTTG
jgi:hypothetical protein